MLFVALENFLMPRPRAPRLSAPFLRRVALDESRIENRAAFPFSLPIFQKGFELEFDRPVTILIGENGIGKSTILAGLAAVAGYEDAARTSSLRRGEPTAGDRLAQALRPNWLPRMTNGWFFRPESYFSLVQREELSPTAGAQLSSHSHGEDFLLFVEERRHRQGVFIFDEPEAALSPARQIEFLKLLRRMESTCQVIMATDSPLLMAFPGARLLRLSERGLKAATLEATDHYRLLLGFCSNPREFVRVALEEEPPTSMR
jgi:predicted ATPase